MKRTTLTLAVVAALLAGLAIPSYAARIEGIAAAGRSTTVFQVDGNSTYYNAQVFGVWGTPIDAQDETSYDNSPTTEGVFVGGTGHSAADVITLSDGTTVTVDNETAGVVDQFTLDTSASTGADAGDVLTQSSSTGSGVGFTLTPDTDNVTVASAKIQMRCGSTFDAALPWHDMADTGAPYTTDAIEGPLGFGGCQIGLFLTLPGTATDLDFELTGGRSEVVRIVTPE